jgi:hypothetical protein
MRLTFAALLADVTGGFPPPPITEKEAMSSPADWEKEEEHLASALLAAGDPTGWFAEGQWQLFNTTAVSGSGRKHRA